MPMLVSTALTSSKKKIKISFKRILFALSLLVFGTHYTLQAQTCTTGQVYAVQSPSLRSLYLLNPTTEVSTLVQADIFGGGAAKTMADAGGHAGTTAFALAMNNNTIWFANRGNATDPIPKIFSYNLNSNTFGATVATFAGVAVISNFNKAAYNPADGNIYFHNSTNNHLYRFNPTTPTVAAVDLGTLSVPGFVGTANFSGGDIAFDGLGNLTGAFATANILAVFFGQYNANGDYVGLSLSGQKVVDLTISPASVAFLADGNYLVGGNGGSIHVNTNTGVQTDLSALNFSSSDFASCAAPKPNILLGVNKTATSSCTGATALIQYTITVNNSGDFHAFNSKLIETLPAGLTLVSATLNGTAIAGINAAALASGIFIKSPSAVTDGQVFKGETATIVLNCTAPAAAATYSNQAFVIYTGVESLNLPNDQVPSDDPATVAINDATVINTAGCLTIQGTVFNDANGNADNTINGTGTGSAGAAQLYVYATNAAGLVLASATVAADGSYTLSGLPANTIYTVILSTSNVAVGTSNPAVTLPTGWGNTAEYIGAGAGNDGTANGRLVVNLGTNNANNANFGINDPPPIAANDTGTYIPTVAKTIDVVSNDNTGDAAVPTTVSIVGGSDPDAQGDNLTKVVAGEGTWTVNPTTGAITFTPLAGFTGNPTPITYTVKDAQGNPSNAASVTLTADPLPIATNDTDTYTAGSTKTVNVLTNDTTGDAIVPTTVRITTAGVSADGKTLVVAGEGTWTVNPTTGAITFAPVATFKGDPTPISYTGNDADGNTSNAATVTLDASPIATNDTDTYTVGSTKTVNVLTNDNTGDVAVPTTVSIVGGSNPDAQGDNLTKVVAGEGTWTVNPTTGAITFTPLAGFTGNPTAITYTMKDAQGNPSNAASVTLTADPLPIATNDVSSYTPTVAKTIDVVSNDNTGDAAVPTTVSIVGGSNPDAQGDNLTKVVAGEGTWTVNPTTGAITFTPLAGFTGNPTPITYTVKDAQGNPSNAASVTLTADPLPIATNDTGTYTPTVAKTIDVLTNDNTGDAAVPTTVSIVGGSNPDAQGDNLTKVVAGEGTWTVNPTTGAITFTPLAGFTGSPTPITYTVKDAQGNPSNAASVTLTADPLPIATNDVSSYTPTVAKTIDVVSNDNTGDAAVPTTVSIVGGSNPDAQGDNLTKIVAGEGTWTVNPTTGAITFTPQAGFTGNPTPITYTVKDAQGNPSNAASVTLTADPLPIATNDVSSYTPTIAKTIDVVSNDNTGDVAVPTTVSIVGGSNPDAQGDNLTKVVAGEGTWTVNPTTGAITFTPQAGFTGNPTPITYTVKDAQGNPSNAASVTLTADPLPIATNDVSSYTPTVAKTIDVLTNDNTGDVAVPTTVSIVGGSNPDAQGDNLTKVVAGEGTWTVNPTTGAITFTPLAGFTGNPTPITYMVKDAQGNPSNAASVTLTADPLPIATNDVSSYTPTIAKTIDVVSNDNTGDVAVPTTVSIVGGSNPDAQGDNLTRVVAGEGTWTVHPTTGAITFTPLAGFTGNPTPITYTVKDAQGNLSNAASVTLTADPLPIATNDMDTYTAGSTKTVNVLTNDTTGDAIVPTTVKITTAGVSADGKTLVVAGEGTWTVHPTTGAITFAPVATFKGDPTPISYTGNDADGNVSNAATVTLDASPIATNDTDTYTAGTSKTVNVLTNDTTGDAIVPTTVKITTVGVSADGKTLVVAGQGTWTVNPTTGAITFVPVATFKGDPTPISYTGADNDGNVSNTATVTLDASPIATNDTDTYTAGSTKTINVLTNDTTGDVIVPTTVKITTAGVSADGKTLVVAGEGTWTVHPTTGAITFAPVATFKGDPTPITYTGADNDGNTSNAATVTLDASPIATNDTDTYTAGTSKTVNVLTNDTTGDAIVPTTVKITTVGVSADGKTLVVAGEGTWTVNPTTGAITFVPVATFKGDPTPISYTGNDADGNTSNAATVTLDASPIATNDTDTYTAGSTKTINVLINDTTGDAIVPASVKITTAGVSADGKTLVVAGEGTWTVNPTTGAITFAPVATFKGDPTPITYTGADNDGNTSNAATVRLDASPIANNDEDLYTAGTSKTVDVLGNDTAGDAIVPASIKITTAGVSADGKTLIVAGEGTWAVNSTMGTITFTPLAGFRGDPTPITYTGQDNEGNTSNQATIILRTPSIQLTKKGTFNDVNKDGKAQVGESITYTFKVENTSNVIILDIKISDAKVIVNGGPITLQPKAKDETSFTAVYIITQADLDAGQVNNLATVTGKDPSGNPVTDDSENGNAVDPKHPAPSDCLTCTVTPLPQTGAIRLTKTGTFKDGNGDGKAQVGEIIEYAFKVENTGNITISGITITDLKVSVKGGPISLAPGAKDETTFTASYVLTQADLDAGQVNNLATAMGKDPKGGDVTDDSENGNTIDPKHPAPSGCLTCTVTPLPQTGVIALVKEVSNKGTGVNGVFVLGNTIEYTFTISNRGNVTLNNIEISDPKLATTPFKLPGSLTPGASISIKRTYLITAADIAAGKVENTAVVRATDPKGNPVTDRSGSNVDNDNPTVTSLAKPPVAVDDQTKTPFNKPVQLDILKNDKENGAPFQKNSIEIIDQPKHGTLTINPDGTVTYTPFPGYTGQDSFTYRVKDANGNWTNVATVTIEVEGFFIPNLFTPNGDGNNDTFEIVGLHRYVQNNIVIVNRWGNEVFRSSGYQNNWTGEGLNEGTYIYLLKVKKTNSSAWEVYKGTITLIRTFKK